MPLLNEIRAKIERDFHRQLPDIYFELLKFSNGFYLKVA